MKKTSNNLFQGPEYILEPPAKKLSTHDAGVIHVSVSGVAKSKVTRPKATTAKVTKVKAKAATTKGKATTKPRTLTKRELRRQENSQLKPLAPDTIYKEVFGKIQKANLSIHANQLLAATSSNHARLRSGIRFLHTKNLNGEAVITYAMTLLPTSEGKYWLLSRSKCMRGDMASTQQGEHLALKKLKTLECELVASLKEIAPIRYDMAKSFSRYIYTQTRLDALNRIRAKRHERNANVLGKVRELSKMIGPRKAQEVRQVLEITVR